MTIVCLGSMVTYDYGMVTDTKVLPLTEVRFGGQITTNADANATITNVRCGPEPFGRSHSCLHNIKS